MPLISAWTTSFLAIATSCGTSAGTTATGGHTGHPRPVGRSFDFRGLEGNGDQAWPTPRSRASAVALEGGRRGLLFGGVGQLECEPEQATTADKGVGASRSLGYAHGKDPVHTGRLSSLWRWDSWA